MEREDTTCGWNRPGEKIVSCWIDMWGERKTRFQQKGNEMKRRREERSISPDPFHVLSCLLLLSPLEFPYFLCRDCHFPLYPSPSLNMYKHGKRRLASRITFLIRSLHSIIIWYMERIEFLSHSLPFLIPALGDHERQKDEITTGTKVKRKGDSPVLPSFLFERKEGKEWDKSETSRFFSPLHVIFHEGVI